MEVVIYRKHCSGTNESPGIIALKTRLQSLSLAAERRVGNFTEIELALYPATVKYESALCEIRAD